MKKIENKEKELAHRENASRWAWLFSPVLFFALVAILLCVWVLVEPATLRAAFDDNGRSPFELATLPFYLAIVPIVWIWNPFSGSRSRQIFFATLVTIVAIMAFAKQLDLHQAVLHYCYPQFVGADGSLVDGQFFKPNGKPLVGTPFKARVLTNAAVPFGMKSLILLYFALFFGVFGVGFALLAKRWVLGVFRLSASAWAWGCFGVSGIMVQCSDRLPSWLHHAGAFATTATNEVSRAASLCTCLEEGGELLIAIFAILTIIFSYREEN